MTVVKICGLTSLDDARWAWRCGADLLGFILVPGGPRYIAAEQVARITRALVDEGCATQFVGVFAHAPRDAVRRQVQVAGLHLAQLHGDEPPEYVRTLGLPAIVARRVRIGVDGCMAPSWEELWACPAWALLLDSYDPQRLGGSGRTWDWGLLDVAGLRPYGSPGGSGTWADAEAQRSDAGHPRLIVAGGLTADNVARCIGQARPWGVDVSSGVEASPGRKDHALVQRFIQEARNAALRSGVEEPASS